MLRRVMIAPAESGLLASVGWRMVYQKPAEFPV
jgi:hypothetical protein